MVLASGCAGSSVAVVEAVPPHREEVVVYKPGHIWVHGHWARDGRRWVWREGRYERERPSHVYLQGHWEKRGRTYVWVEGSWKPRGRVIVRD